jgi:hypothetical protein
MPEQVQAQVQEQEQARNQNKNVSLRINRRILSNGLLAGFLMSAYLTFLQVNSYDQSLVLKFGKYILLAIVLFLVLNQAKKILPPISFFKRGIKIGAGVTLLSAIIIALTNIALFFINNTWAFNKFNMEPKGLQELLILDGVMLFEIFVYGMIITFIILQFLKYQSPKGEHLV